MWLFVSVAFVLNPVEKDPNNRFVFLVYFIKLNISLIVLTSIVRMVWLSSYPAVESTNHWFCKQVASEFSAGWNISKNFYRSNNTQETVIIAEERFCTFMYTIPCAPCCKHTDGFAHKEQL